MAVQPYTISVSDEALEDLQHRLAHVRWPDEIPGAEWDYGSNLDYIRSWLPTGEMVLTGEKRRPA